MSFEQSSGGASAGGASSGMSSLLNLTNAVGGTIMQQKGASLAAAGIRQSGAAAKQAAEFNAGLVDLQTERDLRALGRSVARQMGQQRGAFAASGASVSSKSALMLASEALTTSEREVSHRLQNAQLEKQKILFEAGSQAAAAETQARQVEFKSKQNLNKSFTTILGGASQLFGGL